MSYMTFSQSDVCSKKRFTGGREKKTSEQWVLNERTLEILIFEHSIMYHFY